MPGFDPRDPVALTQALVRCPSVTPAEGGALQLLSRIFEQAGFETHLVTFSDSGTADIINLYARAGPRDCPALMFAGHTDVVPTGDEADWIRPPFSGDLVDGEVFGRGAVDMKGGLAAGIAASLRHLETHPGSAIAFLITGDEEGPAINGTVKLLDWAVARGEHFGHCILGEPTNPETLGDMVKIGRRGSLSGTITVHGRQGHVAYPHLADNPVAPMLRILSSLADLKLDEGTEHFDASNLEIIHIDTGTRAFNVIPGAIKASFNIRFNDLWTRQSLEQRIRNHLAAIAGPASCPTSCTVQFERSSSDAFLTRPDRFLEVVTRAIEIETGRKPALSTSGGTSDARFIKNVCPVIEFGLVGKTMHQINERVCATDLEKLTRIYQRILELYRA